jgi:hypothetical protein
VRELVGRSPAKLEELADIPDADQPVAGPPGWLGSRGPGSCRVGRATQCLPLATAGSGSSMILAPGAQANACLCPVLDDLRPVPQPPIPPIGTIRGYLVSLAVIPGLGILRGTLVAAGGTFSRPESIRCPRNSRVRRDGDTG